MSSPWFLHQSQSVSACAGSASFSFRGMGYGGAHVRHIHLLNTTARITVLSIVNARLQYVRCGFLTSGEVTVAPAALLNTGLASESCTRTRAKEIQYEKLKYQIQLQTEF